MGFFNIHSVAKHRKIEGGPLGIFFRKKVPQCQKKLKGGPFSLSRYGMLRGKRGKTFLIQLARPNGFVLYEMSCVRNVRFHFCTKCPSMKRQIFGYCTKRPVYELSWCRQKQLRTQKKNNCRSRYVVVEELNCSSSVFENPSFRLHFTTIFLRLDVLGSNPTLIIFLN